MLVGMGMRTSGTITQGILGAIVASFPTIDILTVSLVFDSCFGDSITFSVFNK